MTSVKNLDLFNRVQLKESVYFDAV